MLQISHHHSSLPWHVLEKANLILEKNMLCGRNTLGTCNISVYVLGTKKNRIVSFKSSVFHQVPPPREVLEGVISSPFGWRSGQPLCLFCKGVSCQNVLWSCWAAQVSKKCSTVGYNTEWMFFWLCKWFCQMDALSPKSKRHEQSWIFVPSW